MSVSENSKVDGLAIEQDGKTLMMLITDHLDWEKENEYTHLMALQAKINAYVEFIESKQYTTVYPYKTFEKFRIEIYFRHGLNDNCNKFINMANEQFSGLNIILVPKDRSIET